MVFILSIKDIAKIFEEIELRLISSLKRNLGRHKAWEQQEGFNWSAWQAEKLKNMESFRRQNKAIMDEYVDIIDDDTRQLMEEQFREGEQLVDAQVEELKQSNPETDRSSIVTHENFFGVNEQKMQSLMNDITTIEKTVETAALRMTDDIYRQTVSKVQLEMATGSMTLTQAVDLATRDFLDKGINCIIYSDGKRVNIADYVRMALRTTSTRATLQGQAKRFAELGYDTVLVSQYGGCSKTCEPWQGKVYIDDVFTPWHGEKDGDYGISNYCGKKFMLLSAAIRGGLFHPNCRHTLSQYIDGVTQIPEPIPAEKIRQQRELEQKQRAMERKIRKLKRFSEGTLDPDTAQEYRKQLREAQHELKVFVDEHNDVLHRDYSREKYYGEAVDKPEESGKKSPIELEKVIKKPVEKVVPKEPKYKFVEATTIEEAEKFATDNGVRHADYSDLPLESANLFNRAIMTIPEDIRPVFVGSSTKLKKALSMKSFSRKDKDFFGVHMNVLQLYYGEYPNLVYDFEGGNVVAISSRYKTANKIHEMKVKSNKVYASKHDGHTQFFNENGESTFFHEIGHVYEENKGLPEGFKEDAQRWYKEIKCDMLKDPSEAWAEAWGAYHTKNPDLPDYIAKYIDDATLMPVDKSSESGIIKADSKIKISMQFFAKKSEDFATVKLSKKEYAHVMSEIATNISEEQKSKKVFSKPIGNHMYLVENNGFGNYRIIGKEKLK